MLILAFSQLSKCEKSSSLISDEESKHTSLNEAAEVTRKFQQAEKQLARLNALYYIKRQEILRGLKLDVDQASDEESLERNFSDDDVYDGVTDRKIQHMDAKRSSSDNNNKPRGNNKRGNFLPYRFSFCNILKVI